MNKAGVTALAILIVMCAVVEKGDSMLRGGREKIYSKLGVLAPPPDEYFDYAEMRPNLRLDESAAERG